MENQRQSVSSWQSSVACCKKKQKSDCDSLKENPDQSVFTEGEAKPPDKTKPEGGDDTVFMNPRPEVSPFQNPVSSPSPGRWQPVKLGGDYYVALYDYPPHTEEDLSFNAGDTLDILDKSCEDWWIAIAVTGRSASKQGYIPANYVAPVQSMDAERWYFPNTKRHDAEKLLSAKGNKAGSFLIRSPENLKTEFALSVLDEERVKHYKIQNMDNGHYYLSKAKSFSTIKELVEYYSQNAGGLCRILGEPCTKMEIPPIPPIPPNTGNTWEIDRKSIKLQKKLGTGQFGEVYEGLWNGTRSVAVKTLKPDKMHPTDFLKEAEIMMKLRHPKLIQLYGVCTSDEPFYIITELMNSSLLEHLQKDKGITLSFFDQIEMAAQVASGMAYLESQNYIHRDLAARNVLVGENNICKVADFGLARVLKNDDMYEAKEGTQFPVKWTAPEVIRHNKFTIKSDVWSFGIFLYEIMTFGKMPYPGMSNMQVVLWLTNEKNRMPCPSRCPKEVHNIMMDCWKEKAQDRPTFETLQWEMESLFYLDVTSDGGTFE